MNIRDQVLEFHRAADQPVLETPQVPPDDRVRLRARLAAEEFFELLLALYAGNGHGIRSRVEIHDVKAQIARLICVEPVNVDLIEVADACADLDYVVEGLRLEFGINGELVGEEVHRSNMAKLGPGSRKREDGKQLKPPGWTPPDIARVFDAQKQGVLAL